MIDFKPLLLSICILGSAACTSEADVSSKSADPSKQVAAADFDVLAMDKLLSSAVERGDVLGVQALVFDEGQTVYRNSFGLADRERNVAVQSDTVYRVYSMTKPVTSALIMDLIEEGKLNLSDPASKYIPQLAKMKVVSLGTDLSLIHI